MSLSVVVPTLNARDELADCLDALAEHAPDAEVVVVNGPSADGTTGMVQDRADVDVLVELADRSINCARNAGLDHATGETVAFVNHTLSVCDTWCEAVTDGLVDSHAVTGPTRTQLRAGVETERKESREIAGTTVTYFNPGNVAFRRETLEELDGFDEYLEVGGARDAAHRLALGGFEVRWDDAMHVRQELGADGGRETDWDWKYRSLSYRLVKNYGFRPTVVRRLLTHAGRDAGGELRRVARGDSKPSTWLGAGKDVTVNLAVGLKDGLVARRRDAGPRRNPRGRSARSDRAVTVYDWR
ncbi:glycosyltransferase family 2 protein [Salinirussus salinus]|jgi:glycosyltransferase involved in cell wall biosynthesis|uniref:glycosyltransferase family 2 protein n=1 Tax=Salinirussus salinus TaxID=1198300 RepID=UPI00135AF0D7|nr:glycosyltransferase family A protein [Salinirussus salinus]